MKHLMSFISSVATMAIVSQQSVLGTDFHQQNECTNSTKFKASEPQIRDDCIIDFEDEWSFGKPVDQSKGSVKWKVEDYNSPWEPECRVPRPKIGKKYIRVDRGSLKSFGVAVLSSPDIVLIGYESLYVTFSFWIRSKWPKFNSLQVLLFTF